MPNLPRAYALLARELAENHKCCLLLHRHHQSELLLSLVGSLDQDTAEAASSALRGVRLHVV